MDFPLSVTHTEAYRIRDTTKASCLSVSGALDDLAEAFDRRLSGNDAVIAQTLRFAANRMYRTVPKLASHDLAGASEALSDAADKLAALAGMLGAPADDMDEAAA